MPGAAVAVAPTWYLIPIIDPSEERTRYVESDHLYGSMVFNEHVMRERLPKTTYKQLMKTIKEGAPLNEDVANVVAHAMKEWAIEKGATHYTHWFQPLTGITSEKHDSFIDPTDDARHP